MAISKISATELATVADANTLVSTYSASGTTIERGETFTLPSGGTTAVSNGALRLEAFKGDCTITNNGNSTLTNASGVDGTVIMRSGASDFPAFVKNSSMGSYTMSTPAREKFTGDVTGTVSGTVNGTISGATINSATFPPGHIVATSRTSHLKHEYHVSTTSGSFQASGIIVSHPATSGYNYNLVTFSTSTYLDVNSEMNIKCYASYNGGAYAVIGSASDTAGPRHGSFANTGHNHFSYTWLDDSGSTSAGTNLYQIYFFEVNTSGTAYLVHQNTPFLFMVQEVKV